MTRISHNNGDLFCIYIFKIEAKIERINNLKRETKRIKSLKFFLVKNICKFNSETRQDPGELRLYLRKIMSAA